MSTSNLAISTRGLSKAYTITHEQEKHSTLAESFLARLRRPLRRRQQETFWALNGVSFDVKQGEIVGIIGRNGAGKSTLLKILSRITEPTSGEIDLYGRVGSLLEVGTGFHPELSGRENIYLNGQILGMRRTEIERQFDAIVEFAEVDKFLDTPVKRYSSGMYVRLAFAVAAHLNPEILVVDEVLAVGDAKFQSKCLGKMGQVARTGKTVLFVSHNMSAVTGLCERAIWIHGGRIRRIGACSNVVSEYLESDAHVGSSRSWNDIDTAPGNEYARLQSVSTQCSSPQITVATPVKLQFKFWNLLPGARINLSVVLYTVDGVCVFNAISVPENLPEGLVEKTFEIPAHFLNDGVHRVRLLMVRDEGTVLLDLADAAQFEVRDIEREFAWHGKWIGATRPRFHWDTKLHASPTHTNTLP